MATEKKSGAGNRRQFVRTRVPLAERVASVVIVVLLAAIGVAIAIKGKHFNPDLFAVRTDSLKSTAVAVAGKGGTASSATVAAPVPEISSDKKTGAAEEPAPDGGA